MDLKCPSKGLKEKEKKKKKKGKHILSGPPLFPACCVEKVLRLDGKCHF
jgi:hypothetical protein